MTDLWLDPTTTFGVYGIQQGFQDLLAILCDGPRDTFVTAQASDIQAADLLAASSFSFSLRQESASQQRFAGEGADTNTLLIGNMVLHGTFKMPLYAPAIGWVEPAFARLWDQTRMAYWGSASSALGGLILATSAGAQALVTNNVAEFVELPTPFTLWITEPDGTTEQTTVSSITKATRTLSLATPTATAHTTSAMLVARPALNMDGVHGPLREPAFSLISLREGMLSPALVSRLVIDAQVDQPVEIECEVVALGIQRGIQADLRARYQDLQDEWSVIPPLRVVQGFAVNIGATSANAGAFGLVSALGDPLFAGFQGLGMPDVTARGIRLEIDNHLKEVHTNWSQNTDGHRLRDNRMPFAVYSEGRTIKGTLNYRSPIEPLAVAERLAGPSCLNGGGIYIDYGICQVPLPEIGWKPTQGTGDVKGDAERSLEFSLVSETFDAMPELNYSTQS